MDIIDVVFVYQMHQRDEIQWHSRKHSHGPDEYEIHYFLNGSGLFANGKTQHTISSGFLFLSSPTVSHSVKVTASNPVTYYAVLIQIPEQNQMICQMLNNLELKMPFKVGTNYRFFFEEIKKKGLSKDRLSRQSACHQLLSLLYQLDSVQSHTWNVDAGGLYIEKALRIMQKNVMGNLTLTELAGELQLSNSYFIRLFNKRMHQSPMQYYMRLKIEAGGALLTSTNYSVKEIAEKLGFSSEFHFSKTFKLKTGQSPSIYRMNYIQQLGIPKGKEKKE